ncbi:SH3 domain-containing protein [Leptolyngbya sp. FACHB-321]|uniref:SH3 domain-containing protein n=1 Tax=Leptolyngbya sp. FACHB-321 TaxID=2692807 RepID=UPI00168688B3|nr:SH3 domain-containing protein [Leptolyngbya sp. FACHB-321]MBD2034893.1 SH3 domain-containing protein [Leptolyngbya sp. FACHB-321]
MSWGNLTKLLSGVLLAIALIVSGCFFAAQHVIAQFTAPPPKPTFPNDNPGAKAKLQPTAAAKPATKSSPKPSVTPSPSPQPTEAAGYRARITLSQGLNLRESASQDSARIGGVAVNTRITVLEDSSDGEWQRVRLEESGREGWVKAGYTERVNP